MLQNDKKSSEKTLLDLLYDDRAMALVARWSAFNPFRILRADRYEIRHTNALGWLLDPRASHGMGDLFLRGFIKAVSVDTELRMQYETGLGAPVKVRREVSIRGNALYQGFELEEELPEGKHVETKGRIDLLLEGGDWAIAIEAKIDSGEGPGQLKKYTDALVPWAKTTKKHLTQVFLTLGEAAPDEVADQWTSVTWDHAVASPLRAALAACAGTGAVGDHQHSFLNAYLEILDDLSETEASASRQLLIELAKEYEAPLKNLKLKKPRRRKGVESDQDLILLERNRELLQPLLAMVDSPRIAAAEMVRAAISTYSPVDLELVKGNNAYIRFIPADWRSRYPSIIEGDDPSLPRVVFEVYNKDRATIRLMLFHLGEGFAQEPGYAERRMLLDKLRNGEAGSETPFNLLFRGDGRPYYSPEVLTIMSRPLTIQSGSAVDASVAPWFMHEDLGAFLAAALAGLEPYLSAVQ